MALDNPKERLAKVLNAGLADNDAQALRERVAREVPAALASNGHRLSMHYRLEPDAAGFGFATAIEMAAELGEGALRLYEGGLWYPGCALIRQLVECGYLLTLMSENREEAQAWMTSSHEQIITRFMPRQMTKRAVPNFRPREYETHCDLGGHPNPAGRTLLRRHAAWQPLSSRSHWVDLGQHLTEIWSSFVAALPLYDPRMNPNDSLYSPHRSPDGGEAIGRLIAEWQDVDPAAARTPVPEMEHEAS